jgi:simple sugar transport system ATP-binding protein
VPGKSTLIKIVTGVYQADRSGPALHPRPPGRSRRYSVRAPTTCAVEAVHQEKSLADKRPLWRNLFVGRQITNRLGFINVRRQKEVAGCCSGRSASGAGIDAPMHRRHLSAASAGHRDRPRDGNDADLIILDEPTVALR